MDLQALAEDAREYCEVEQNREFELKGACHENAIGAADYIRLRTDYNPVIVWGVVSHKSESVTADTVSEVCEKTTHFWNELEEVENGIIDVYTNNPLVGDISKYVQSGIAYGGEIPKCYNTVEKFRYFGELTSHDLSHKNHLRDALNFKAVEKCTH